MTTRPPYPYLVLGKRGQALTTAGGGQAYTHLLLEIWSFIPTVLIVALLLVAAAWCLSTGALDFQAGRLAIVTCVILALIPIGLSYSELSPWLGQKQASR